MQHGFADATASVYCLRMERLTIRKASASDTDRIVELFAGDPGDEASGIAGSREKAIAFGTGMVRLPESPPGLGPNCRRRDGRPRRGHHHGRRRPQGYA